MCGKCLISNLEKVKQGLFTCFKRHKLPSITNYFSYHSTKELLPLLLTLSSLPAPFQSSPPPPPPSSSSSSSSSPSSSQRPRSTSNIFPPTRFTSGLVNHYLSEIKTTVPRIPQNLRGLTRGVSQKVALLCVRDTLILVLKFLLHGVCIS